MELTESHHYFPIAMTAGLEKLTVGCIRLCALCQGRFFMPKNGSKVCVRPCKTEEDSCKWLSKKLYDSTN